MEGLDYATLGSLIGSIGFPIVACCALYYLYDKTITKLTTTLDKVDRTLEEEQPLYQHLYIHLEKIDNVVAPLPKGFATTLKRLGFKWKQEL